jgi:hypothetical protein
MIAETSPSRDPSWATTLPSLSADDGKRSEIKGLGTRGAASELDERDSEIKTLGGSPSSASTAAEVARAVEEDHGEVAPGWKGWLNLVGVGWSVMLGRN